MEKAKYNLETAMQQIISNGYFVVRCPYCDRTHNVEPDADYEKECDCSETFKVEGVV